MKLTSLSLNDKRTKYANFMIFNKREYAFHKSIENNKKFSNTKIILYLKKKKDQPWKKLRPTLIEIIVICSILAKRIFLLYIWLKVD